MQTTDETYKRLIAKPNHWFDTKVVINGVTYGTDKLISMSTSSSLFSDSNPTVGCCVSSTLELEMIKPSVTIPRMASVIPHVRVVCDGETSKWIQKGKYFIDTRSASQNGGTETLKLTCYDAMLKTEQSYDASSTEKTSALDKDMVKNVADQIKCDVNTDNIKRGYTYSEIMGTYSCREILSIVAASYGGNFYIDDTGTLRLIKLSDLIGTETYLLTDNMGYHITFGGDRIKWQT